MLLISIKHLLWSSDSNDYVLPTVNITEIIGILRLSISHAEFPDDW